MLVVFVLDVAWLDVSVAGTWLSCIPDSELHADASRSVEKAAILKIACLSNFILPLERPSGGRLTVV